MNIKKHIAVMIVVLSIFIITSCGGGSSSSGYAIAQGQITEADNRALMFQSLPQTPGGIMFIGDSNTQYCEWHELLGVPIKNRGIAGQSSADLLTRIRDFVACQPDKVFIMIGTVDIGHGVSQAVTLANYNLIIDAVRQTSPASQIFVESVLPLAAFNGAVVSLNAQLDLMCQQKGVTFINHYPAMYLNGGLNPAYTYDNTHLTGAGYLVLATILAAYI